MESRRIQLLKKIYTFRDGFFYINLSISKYADLFNNLDPDPMRIRDIDHSLRKYLSVCSAEIPLKYKIKIQAIADEKIRDPDMEQKVISGLKTYFQFTVMTSRRKIADIIKKSLVYMVLAAIFLSASFLLRPVFYGKLLHEIVGEGLSIGGWVFLWETIALIGFKIQDTGVSVRRYNRLEEAEIIFRYED